MIKPRVFRYVFGGIYRGGKVPEGMEVYEIRKGTWAVFNCVGKLPDAMEEMSNLIWNHRVPDNAEYIVDGQCEFELYYKGDYYNDPEYLCTKWIPVKKRQNLRSCTASLSTLPAEGGSRFFFGKW